MGMEKKQHVADHIPYPVQHHLRRKEALGTTQNVGAARLPNALDSLIPARLPERL